MREILTALVIIMVIFGGVFTLGNWGLFTKKYFGTRNRAIDNAIFKESEQYNDGMLRDLYNLRLEYINADTPEKKIAIAGMIRHRFSVYDKNRLPYDLRSFLDSVQ